MEGDVTASDVERKGKFSTIFDQFLFLPQKLYETEKYKNLHQKQEM